MPVNVVEANVWDIACRDVPVAHCVSADFALGAGFAQDVANRYPSIRRSLREQTANMTPPERVGRSWSFRGPDGQVVYNLATKRRYFERADRDPQPNADTLARALRELRRQSDDAEHTHIVMPKIGSGLDRMPWSRTFDILEHVFEGFPLVTVCELAHARRSFPGAL